MNLFKKLKLKIEKKKDIDWKIGVRNSLKKMPYKQLLIVRNMLDAELNYRGMERKKCSK